jgi:acyl-CoA thioester hydrolase
MDAFAHVNNVAYFRYFEHARVAYLTHVGWFDLMRSSGIGPIVHSTAARFRRPVKYPETLRVGVRVSQIDADRVTMEHRVVTAAGEVAADGPAVVVCYDYRAAAKTPLPPELRARIEELERGSFGAKAHG